MHLFLPANLQCNIIPRGCKKRIHQILKGYKAIRNFDVSPNPSPGGAGFIKVFDHIDASSMASCWKSCSPSINTRSGAWKPVANCSHSDMVSHGSSKHDKQSRRFTPRLNQKRKGLKTYSIWSFRVFLLPCPKNRKNIGGDDALCRATLKPYHTHNTHLCHIVCATSYKSYKQVTKRSKRNSRMTHVTPSHPWVSHRARHRPSSPLSFQTSPIQPRAATSLRCRQSRARPWKRPKRATAIPLWVTGHQSQKNGKNG